MKGEVISLSTNQSALFYKYFPFLSRRRQKQNTNNNLGRSTEKTIQPQIDWRRSERIKGFEPSRSAWEADMLPLHHIRKLN